MSYRNDIKYVQQTQRQRFKVKPTFHTTNKPLAFNKTKAYYSKNGEAKKVYYGKIYIPKKYHGSEMGRLSRIHELRENLDSQHKYRVGNGTHRKAMQYFKQDIRYVKRHGQ